MDYGDTMHSALNEEPESVSDSTNNDPVVLSSSPTEDDSDLTFSTSPVQLQTNNLGKHAPHDNEKTPRAPHQYNSSIPPWMRNARAPRRPPLSQLPSEAISDSSTSSAKITPVVENAPRTSSPSQVSSTEQLSSVQSTRRTDSRVPSVQFSQHASHPEPQHLTSASLSRESSRSQSHTPVKVSGPSTPTGFMKHRHSSSASKREVKETLDAHIMQDDESTDDDHSACGDSPAPHSHRRLNQYRLGPILGRGSAGTVELAVDDDGKQYAVKEFSKHQLRKRKKSEAMKRARKRPGQRQSLMAEEEDEEKSDALALIRLEVAIMKKLDHPNLVRLYEVLNVQDSDLLYLVMELCKGGPITKVVVDEGPIDVDLQSWTREANEMQQRDVENDDDEPPDRRASTSTTKTMDEDLARDYFRQIILGVEYLHANDIVHRDIKPENIMLTEDKVMCKIVDFGVSEQFVKHGDDVSKKSVGTPAFMSPELSLASGNLGVHARAADIWAMGVTLYCIVIGCLPFVSGNVLELVEQIRTQPADIPSWLSEDLQDLLSKLLEKSPEKRINMDGLREHPWITQGGESPLPSKADNIAICEEPTKIEMQEAVGSAQLWSDILASVKVAKKLKRLANQRSPKRGFSVDEFTSPVSTTGSNSSRSSTLNTLASSTSSHQTSVVSTSQSTIQESDLETKHMRGHGKSGSLSIDDTFLDTVRYVENQTGADVVKRDADLQERPSSRASNRS